MGLNINIDNHYISKIYTNGSSVSGSVLLCPEIDIPFHCLQITLVGTSHTRIDMLPVPKVIDNDFLRLDMPIDEKVYPADRVFKAGTTYNAPFEFTIPQTLLKDPCDDVLESGHIHDLHMRLPPTMGGWEKDDMSPVMASVEYVVLARVLQKHTSDLSQATEASRAIKVIPAFPEDPPLRITNLDTRYALSKSKSIRKKVLSMEKYSLDVTASQPRALHLGTTGHQLEEVPASAVIDFSFVSDSPFTTPPEVKVAQLKLEALTWFSAVSMKTLPELGEARNSGCIKHELKYVTSIKLPATDVGQITWTREDSVQGQGSTVWRAAATVPLQLPTTQKMFLPTFYSCYLARTYVLHLQTSVSGTKVCLSVPLQISTEASGHETSEPVGEELPTFDAALAWR